MPHCVGTKQFNSTYFIAYIKFNERWQRPRQLCKYLHRKSYFSGIKFDKSTYWADSYDEKIHFFRFQLVLFDERFLPNFVFTFFNSFMLTCSWYVVNLTLNETNVNALSTEKNVFHELRSRFLSEFPFQIRLTGFRVHKKSFKKISIPDGPNINGKHTRRFNSHLIEGLFFKIHCCEEVSFAVAERLRFGWKKKWKHENCFGCIFLQNKFEKNDS